MKTFFARPLTLMFFLVALLSAALPSAGLPAELEAAAAAGGGVSRAPAGGDDADKVRLGRDFSMPREVFEKLTAAERIALFQAAEATARASSMPKIGVAVLMMVAIVGALLLAHRVERSRLETMRRLVEAGHPVPEGLRDSTNVWREGRMEGSRWYRAWGGIMWIVAGIAPIVMAHVRKGEIGMFWAFSVFIVVGIGTLVAVLRQPDSKA